MKKRIKSIVGLMLASTMLFAASAGNVYAEEAQEEVTLKILTISDQKDFFDAAIEAYTATNPNIKFEYEDVAYDALLELVETKMASGTSEYDIISVDGPLTAAYAYRGYLQSLDNYFTEEEKADYVESALIAGTYNNVFYAAPLTTGSCLLYFNIDLLEEAGVEIPSATERMTWEELAEICQTIQAKINPDGNNGKYAFAFEQFNQPYQLLPLPNSLGGVAVAEDGVTTDGIINNEAWLKACTYLYDMFNTWKIAPKGMDYPHADFNAGKIAFVIAGEWGVAGWGATEGLNYGYTLHPYFEDGTPATPTGGWHLGIPASSTNPEAAADFIKYITATEESQQMMYETKGYMTPYQPALDNLIASDNLPEGMKLAMEEASATAVPRPVMVGWQEWQNIMYATFSDICNGADPEEALNSAVLQLDEQLAKYKE